jgi:two-component system invasion response regulator UvrY
LFRGIPWREERRERISRYRGRDEVLISVIIADDHLLIREGLKKLLADEDDMKVVAEARDAEEVIRAVEGETGDVLILDVTMPGASGLELLQRVREENPDIRILVLSMHPESLFATRALRMGASGYITKEGAADELVTAIRKVAGGRKYVSEALAEQLASKLNEEWEKPLHASLSDREMQVFRLIAEGKTVAQIAEALFLSKSTVNTYRSRILKKMGMTSNAEVIHYAIRNNLIS